ncbi:hypothetical protein [Actinomycetospora chiangmaiensis]|uniref:hypothetical protein n=1 Tax=Actinomycetospora chiangmaiensis TaxID=402650 RepID=UPI0012F771DF|nr:hypothetical protein [Actinomycetospora chiangmaiensis]
MTQDRLAQLRADVARQSGAARVRPLTELGRELSMEYWRVGPGQAAAQPVLDEAVEVLGEAYDRLEPGEVMTARTAAMLGWLLGTRTLAHGGSPADRDRAIPLLEEATDAEFLEFQLSLMARFVLGQLLLFRSLHRLQSGGTNPMSLLGGGSPGGDADSARAMTCFREVAADPGAPREATEAAHTMIGLAEMVQTLTGGGGMDLGRIMTAFGKLQDLQQQMSNGTLGTRLGADADPFRMGDVLAQMDPTERPLHTVIEDSATEPEETPSPPSPAPPPSAPTSAPTSTTTVADLRRAFREAVPTEALLIALVEGVGMPSDMAMIDRLVARGQAVLDSGEANVSDRLLHAAALYRRSLIDPDDGWGHGAPSPDLDAAVDEIASVDLVGAPSDLVARVLRLAHRISPREGHREVMARLAAQYRSIGGDLRARGVDGLVYDLSDGLLVYDLQSARLEWRDSAGLPTRSLVIGSRRPAGASGVISVVPSAREAMRLAELHRRGPAGAPVFVANPRDDRPQAGIDTMVLRRTFYPGSLGLGRTVENIDGAGTRDDVLARFEAPLLHLDCGVTPSGELELAGPTLLAPADIASASGADAGIVVLPHGAASTAALSQAFLAAGFAHVLAFTTRLPDDVASLVTFMLHSELVDRRVPPAQAVHHVRQWLLDPARAVPEHLPAWYQGTAADADLADLSIADALVHHGV